MVKKVNFNELFSARMKEVGQVVESYLPEVSGYQATVLEAMDYSVKAGGKRLRPMLMEETYRLFGGSGKEIEPFMAAIEMIHTSSLIHDDLPCMDNDTLRRGLPTAWVKFGYDMAVLAGDGLLIYSMETAAKAISMTDRADRVARSMGILAEKTGIFGMIGGQTVDVELSGEPVPKEKLEFIYRLKTGALLEASMMIGALLGGAGEEELKQVERMAALIGMAFQI
ncbi:polyprenyl synthetase family protein, partial [Clostridium butyricum]|uniref:polyprenyl synthetase family protein n=1 Tax=Clostridium butyricum TaxID=1492 RepID=UPI0034671365